MTSGSHLLAGRAQDGAVSFEVAPGVAADEPARTGNRLRARTGDRLRARTGNRLRARTGSRLRARTENRPLGWPGKRAFDVVVAVVLLVLVVPLTLLIALAIKLTSRGPVLFRQRRVGFGGREFSILKFRTMQADAEARLFGDESLLEVYQAGDCKIPSELDPRITPIGRFLRRSSLDELPQLLNVLAGSMSLVGPRPVRGDELVHYGERESAYLVARPGMTGLWQVSGRNHVKFPHRASLDESYSQTCSLAVDLLILCRTLAAVVSARGAY